MWECKPTPLCNGRAGIGCKPPDKFVAVQCNLCFADRRLQFTARTHKAPCCTHSQILHHFASLNHFQLFRLQEGKALIQDELKKTRHEREKLEDKLAETEIKQRGLEELKRAIEVCMTVDAAPRNFPLQINKWPIIFSWLWSTLYTSWKNAHFACITVWVFVSLANTGLACAVGNNRHVLVYTTLCKKQ